MAVLRCACLGYLAASVFLMTGCGKKTEKVKQSWAGVEPEFTAQQAAAEPELLQTKLRETNAGYKRGAEFAINPQFGLVGQINLTTVTNISALHCAPFAALDLRGTPVSDISPLAGLPLVMLGLEDTKVLICRH